MRRTPLGPRSYEDALGAQARAALRAERRAQRRAEAPGGQREPETGERARGTSDPGDRTRGPSPADRKTPPVPRGARCVFPDCDARAVHHHHVVERRELRKRRGDAGDPRNCVPMCFFHHGQVTLAAARLPLAVLPDSVFEFAEQLMGPAAYDYLARTTVGDDPRLDAILGGAP